MLIDLKYLHKKYDLNIKGVIHIGAHKAEELELYNSLDIKNVVWVEANPQLIGEITRKVKPYRHQVLNYAISDQNISKMDFYLSDSSQTSSLLKAQEILHYHPEAATSDTIAVSCRRIDNVFTDTSILDYNFVNLDIQGAELQALRSFGQLINNVDYIYTEVNLIEHYKSLRLLSEIDNYLRAKGFIRKELKVTRWKWGDAFYVRGKEAGVDRIGKKLSAKYLQLIANYDRLYHSIKPYEY